MCCGVLDSFVFRKPLREGSFVVGWILLVIKATLFLVACIALADMCAVKTVISIEVSNMKNSYSYYEKPIPDPFKIFNTLITIMCCDMIIYLIEMLLSFCLLIGVAKKNWSLVPMFYFVYPVLILANIVVTGIKIDEAHPKSAYSQITKDYAVMTLPFERYSQCAIIVFTFFEVYGLNVVRSYHLHTKEEQDQPNHTAVIPLRNPIQPYNHDATSTEHL